MFHIKHAHSCCDDEEGHQGFLEGRLPVVCSLRNGLSFLNVAAHRWDISVEKESGDPLMNCLTHG